MPDSILYKLNSGKPVKLFDFVRNFAGLAVPDALRRAQLKALLAEAKSRPDYPELLDRANYYCRLDKPFDISSRDRCERTLGTLRFTGAIGSYKRKMFHTAYYFDQHDVTRYFPTALRWNYCPGDVYFTPEEPTVVKSRLLTPDNQNAVLLKLDKLRHFMFVNDPLEFHEKQNRAIFRGKIRHSRLRTAFLQRYFNHPLVDAGVVGRNEGCPDEWMTGKLTIRQHLDYKFIMALEGNDVASNLKWVMSSNSIAVMPRPTCETWFMEGRLEPDRHYLLVRDDFADLPEKLAHYAAHPEEAQTIINNAHEFIRPFRNERRELLIALLVMEKYFSLARQS